MLVSAPDLNSALRGQGLCALGSAPCWDTVVWHNAADVFRIPEKETCNLLVWLGSQTIDYLTSAEPGQLMKYKLTRHQIHMGQTEVLPGN